MTIYREIGDRNGEGRCLGNLGNAYLRLRDIGKALQTLQQAEAIFAEIKSPNLPQVREQIERIQTAQTQDSEGSAGALVSATLTGTGQGPVNRKQAIREIERLKDLVGHCQDTEQWSGAAKASLNLSQQHESLGELDVALKQAQAAVKFYQDAKANEFDLNTAQARVKLIQQKIKATSG